jgi:outer membrane receptor protein involved in Fe transport
MATVAVGGVSFAKVASAQEAAKADEKVTVTGTRIRQRDFTSTSPIATVSSKDIALTGTVNVESLINDLPQIVPGLTVTSNNPSLNGFATADLRGLGVGRTLILVNGRRANPSDRSGAVDLNTIPASLIERIEIISGGASAVYGADAVAGAINFIMRDSFEGVQVSASFQQAEDGEAPALVVDGIMGGKFDSGRGSLMIGLQYYSRQPVQADKREWSRHTSAAMLTAAGDVVISYDPSSFLANNPGSSVFNPAGSGTAPWTSLTGGFSGANVIAASGDVLDADCNPANGIQATGGTIRFTADGQISPFQNCGFAANNNQSEPRNVSDRYNFAPDNYLILENERVNAAVYGKYDIVEGGVMQAFVEANFTNTRSVQQLAATPVTGLTFRADIDPAVGNVVINPYITANAEFLALVNLQYPGAALDNRTFTLNIRPNQGGFRVGTAETNAIGLTYGLRGNMPSLDWDWEIYHGFARNTTNIVAENNVGATAMRQLINACGVTSLAVQAQPLLTLPNCPFPNKAGETFVPTGNTNNPLSLNGMNAAQLAFINVDTTDVTVYERNVLSGSVTGDLWDLWGAGAIGMAMGVEYREESLSSKADPFKAAGDIFGFNAQESIAGKFDVYEAYAEAKVPLLTGVTLFDNLSIEAGYRVSDYSTGAGISQTWKYGVEWSIFEWLTLRAIENHAVRAPTAFELFQAGDQNFPGYGDPCNSVAVNALAPALQPARIATCTAWFAAGGAAYGAVHPAPGFAQVNSQVEAFQIGTQSLQPEIADTLTYGIVFNPEWWPVGRIGLSVDRYEIEIAGVIALRSIANILNGCVDSGGVGPDCLLAPRQADGQIDFVNQTRANANTLETSGIDVNLRWQTELDGLGLPGTFGVQSLYTWVDTYLFNGGENVGFHDGTIGGGIPEHRAATNFTYALDDFNFLVRWTYTGRMEQASFGTEQVDAYNMYDFGSSWDIDENFQVSFGVENIFDTKPQTFADAQIFGQFNTDGSTYDQLGRQYRFGIRWKN